MSDGGPTITAATERQLEQLLDAYEWLFASPGAPPPGWDREQASERLRATISGPDSTALLALRSGKMIGFISAYIDLESVRFGRRCWVEDLAVDPHARSRGVGAALLAAAREWAAERGASHLELDSGEARHDAHRFYERERPSWRSKQYTWLLER